MLGLKGLTLSEASHIANFLKEMVKSIDITPNDFEISTSSYRENGSIYDLDSNKKLENWNDSILLKAKYYSLSAWLNEAIKQKEEICKAIADECFSKNGLVGLMEDIPQPRAKDTSFEYYKFNELSDKELAEFLIAETKAVHIGKFIHSFDVIRDKFKSFKPTTFRNISDDKVITVSNSLLYNEEDLVESVESLTTLHREAEKIVNNCIASHKRWEADVKIAYQVEINEYINERSEVETHNRTVISKETSLFDAKKIKSLEMARALKIEIPEEFKETLDLVYSKLK